jgi:hypothetical protein
VFVLRESWSHRPAAQIDAVLTFSMHVGAILSLSMARFIWIAPSFGSTRLCGRMAALAEKACDAVA